MLKVDGAIYDTNKVICRNISVFDASERGLLSQNILAQLRNFVEYIVQKVYSNGVDTDPNDYQDKKAAWEFIKTKGELRFLSKFHNLLQKSVSHYTFDEGGSERLMLKYYEYLLKIKVFLKEKYNMDVLENIDDFPLNLDDNLMEYYKKISVRIVKPSRYAVRNPYNDRAYIQKIKPFFVNHHIFYEVTFTVANDKASKFDRVIAFTSLDLSDNYAVKLSLHNDVIGVLGKVMPIQIIDSWEVSIRPCEINRFADFFGGHNQINGLYGINNINRFLQSSNPNTEIVWGINTYKIEDPVLFNESDRFAPLIYNNMKGRIKDIEPTEDKIRFDVELDIAITDWEAEDYDFTLVGTSDKGNSIISFWVDKHRSTDDDDDTSDAIVPFQVAYAVSIHKAQGLEYKSVKIVITNEVEELITHNIFYTAITRAKEDLKIYWTPETEKKILEGLSLRNYKKDAALLATMQNL